MATPAILQMLGKQSLPQIDQLRQMVGMIRNAGNPQALLQQMMQQNNPAMVQAMNYVKQHGGDAKAACTALAQEKGINLHDLGL